MTRKDLELLADLVTEKLIARLGARVLNKENNATEETESHELEQNQPIRGYTQHTARQSANFTGPQLQTL